MKKLAAISFLALAIAAPLQAAGPDFPTPAPIAYMEDMSSGAVLFAKDADRRMPPASMAKMMTVYVAFDLIKKGELKRFFSVAPRWCKMLASIVKPECRFVDAATEVLVSQAKPPFAELELLAQFRPAAEQEEAFALS